ncbi:hypothetical protein ACVWZV_001244 [Bradyrhizobium sp. GM5.1]
MKNLKWTLALAASLIGGAANAEISDNVVRVGVLNDHLRHFPGHQRHGLGRGRAHGR